MALQMNVSGIRRNLKNIAHNYTDAQIKVREATSNDPWGPSSTLMSEVADLTYNVVAFTEIMQMIWKRLNDHGRNWRHVYKALVLLEYLIKTGSEKVADQCKENIYAIQTLKDFQYLEENKDQGMNVREKAKALVTLLKDDERLRNERVRALKAKERFAQSVSGIGSDSDNPRDSRHAEELTIICDGDKTYVTSSSRPAERNAFGIKDGPSGLEPQLEAARPQTVGEEELQLQLALAMSKEEAEQEEQKQRSDDVRLQMAITQSEEDFKKDWSPSEFKRHQKEDMSAMNDLLDINFNPHGGVNGAGARSASTPPCPTSLDPWGMPTPATSASPQHTTQPKSLPAAGYTPSPPPIPPLPASSSSLLSSFSSPKITFRYSNPPQFSSTAFELPDEWHRSSTPPNPFMSDTNKLSLSPRGRENTLPSMRNVSSMTLGSYSTSSLLLTPPPQQSISSSLPSSYSLFPQVSTSFLSPPLQRSSVSSPRPASSLSCTTPSEPPADISSLSPSSYNPWGAVQVNIATVTMPPSDKPDPWGSPASGPPSRVTSPPTTSDPWGPPPARSPEPPMGGICGNDPWAVLGVIPPAAKTTTPPAGTNDPWDPVPAKPQTKDPFAPISPTNNGDMDEFSALSIRDKPTNNGVSDHFDLSGLSTTMTDNSRASPPKSKSPAAFLGENCNLVNLDNLVSAKQLPAGLGVSPLNSTNTSNSTFINNNLNNTMTTTTNPFATPGLAPSSFAGVNPFSAPSPPNPFQAQQAPKPSMNQLRTTGIVGLPPSNAGAPVHTTGSSPGPWGSPQPSIGFGVAPAATSQDENPFLL
nr:epsin-1-like isoform X4 [Cherax quadricarinatus]